MILVVCALQVATLIVLFVLIHHHGASMSHFGAAFDNLVQSLNDNTNALAAQFDKLHAELAAAADQGDPITQAQLDALSKINDHLKALGASEVTPVPVAPVLAPVVVERAAPVPGTSSSS